MPLTTYEANRLIQDFLNVNIRLYSTTPTAADGTGGVEVTGGSYTPQAETLTEAADSFSASNGAAVSFAGMPTVDVTGYAIFDSANSNMLAYDDFGTPVSFTAGDTGTWPAGTFVVQVG